MRGVLSALAQAQDTGTSEAQWQAWGGLEAIPRLEIERLLAPGARLLVVSACPEDKALGAAGLMVQAHAQGREVGVLALTDGPNRPSASAQGEPGTVNPVRVQEPSRVLAALGLTGVPVVRLGLKDGGVHGHEQRLGQWLGAMIRPGDVLVSPWRHDGLPDHEACGRACARSAASVGAGLLEVPLWSWRWARPGDVRLPWSQAVQLPLSVELRAAKWETVGVLQAAGLDGQGLLAEGSSTNALAYFRRPYEVFFMS